MSEMSPADVPQEYVDAAMFAFVGLSQTGNAGDFFAYVRTVLAAVLPLHAQQAYAERDEWHRQNGVLRGERNAAIARAEQAEAKVAELESQLAGRGSGTAPKLDVEHHEIAAALGVDLETVNRWILNGDDFEPPFPEPVRFEDRCAEPFHVYSLAEIKAWYAKQQPGVGG